MHTNYISTVRKHCPNSHLNPAHLHIWYIFCRNSVRHQSQHIQTCTNKHLFHVAHGPG